MARQIQIRRGTAVENDSFTGAIGEITMDTTNKTLRVHDGTTVGGTILAKQDEIPNISNLAKKSDIPDISDFAKKSEIPNLSDIDYVVAWQNPTSENNYTWYRKYKSGWVEQGGQTRTKGSAATLITLPLKMSNSEYQIFIQGQTGVDEYSGAQWQVMPVKTTKSQKSETGFYVQASITGYDLYFYWCVHGFIS